MLITVTVAQLMQAFLQLLPAEKLSGNFRVDDCYGIMIGKA